MLNVIMLIVMICLMLLKSAVWEYLYTQFYTKISCFVWLVYLGNVITFSLTNSWKVCRSKVPFKKNPLRTWHPKKNEYRVALPIWKTWNFQEMFWLLKNVTEKSWNFVKVTKLRKFWITLNKCHMSFFQHNFKFILL